MSSEVSSKPLPATPPSFFTLLAQSGRVCRRHASILFGYAGWLLLPLVAHVILRVTFGSDQTSQYIDIAVTVISAIVTIGVYNLIALSVPLFTAKKYDEAEAAALPARAQKLILPVFFVLFLSSIASIMGFALLILPGIIVSVWLAFAGLATLFDHTRGVASLVRSRDLVRGRFWSIFWRIFGIQAITLVVYGIIMSLALLATGNSLLTVDILAPLPLSVDIVASVTEIALLPLIIVYNTLLYLALKNG